MINLMDFKYAIRQLLKSPKFTGLTLFVLVGGLSISLYTFSFLYSLIYKPLPLPEGDSIYSVEISIGGWGRSVPAYEFSKIREQLTTVSEIGLFMDSHVRLSQQDTGKNIPASFVEPDFFQFSRVLPIMGRTITSDDMLPGAEDVALISEAVWQNEFNLAPDIIGQTIKINGANTTVIGIMPHEYRFPVFSKIWLPAPRTLTHPLTQSNETVRVYARLAAGFNREQAEQEINTITTSLYQNRTTPLLGRTGELHTSLKSFPKAQTDGQGGIIFIFFNLIAFFILLLACINVGNLLLARAIDKQKETAIRAALGAPRNRLIMQIMWEGILITVTGSLLATLLVTAALDFTEIFLHSYLPDELAFWWHWGMDQPTLLMAFGFTAVTIFLACFLPAWKATNQDINSTLRDGTRGAQGKKTGKASRILVTVQVFLISTLMLIGGVTAYLANYILNLDSGEDRSNQLTLWISLTNAKYIEPSQQINFYQELLNRLRGRANIKDGVWRAYKGDLAVSIPGQSYVLPQDRPKALVVALIGNTEFYGPKLKQGRHLTYVDHMNARKTAIISQSFANRHWPGENAIEQQLSIEINGKSETLSVVGIVGDLINGGSIFTTQDSADEIYVSGLQFPSATQRLKFKYTGEENLAEESFFQSLYEVDRLVVPENVFSADRNLELMRDSMKMTSNITFIAGGFALLLALTGIYGLTSNAVTQRTHEIGIRRAIGASDKQVMMLFLKQGSRQLIIGLFSGLLVFSLVTYVFQNMTEEIIAWNLYLVLAAAVSIGLSIVVLAAIYAPTQKAVIMEPSTALRYE